MVLAFSTQINGSPTYFVEKIWQSFPSEKTADVFNDYLPSMQRLNYDFHCDAVDMHPKFHTIRKDNKNRWKKGNDIHFSINVRTKNQLRFAPIVKVISVQDIEILHPTGSLSDTNVKIDGRILKEDEVQRLAWNDGFDNLLSFRSYFKEDFKGKLIHWTSLTY